MMTMLGTLSDRPRSGRGPRLVGRIVAEGLTSRLGVQFVVDNRPGASSIIGTELAVKAPPDGYTILLVANTVAVNPSLTAKLPYDALRDLVPLSLVAQTAQVLVITPSLPATSVKEFVALAKAKPGLRMQIRFQKVQDLFFFRVSGTESY